MFDQQKFARQTESSLLDKKPQVLCYYVSRERTEPGETKRLKIKRYLINNDSVNYGGCDGGLQTFGWSVELLIQIKSYILKQI